MGGEGTEATRFPEPEDVDSQSREEVDKRFPMLAKVRDSQADAGVISEFLEFLGAEKGVLEDEDPEKLMNEYFEIDGEKLEAEREARMKELLPASDQQD